MCWILGLGGATTAVMKHFLPGSTLTKVIDDQLEHVDWAGFHFEDLIFPLFLFISGVSMAIAVPKRVARDGKAATVRHLLARAAIIFFLGVIFSGGFREGIDNVRWLGVIQRIGVASAIAGILSMWCGVRGLVLWAVTLLLGYWALLALVPVPGVGAGIYEEGKNLTNYLDSIWLPGRKHDGDHDPEGMLSTLPAIATALLGLLAGLWLKKNHEVTKKSVGLIVGGAVLLALGWAWHPFFPVVKKLWSSSFVLVAGGWSAILLGVFYWIVDVAGWRRWCTPFVWVGANPISLYLASGMGAFRAVNERFVGGLPKDMKWIAAITAFALMLMTARWLYRRGILLKV